jgi:hypothetical protein
MTRNLRNAIKEAHRLASLPNHGGTVYVYQLLTGSYYCSQATPREINAEYIATVTRDQIHEAAVSKAHVADCSCAACRSARSENVRTKNCF